MKKKFLVPALLIAFVSMVASCDNEFSINADWQDVTIIYSLLDPAAKGDTNWVRVERGYLGDAPASESYDKPDSLYYENLVVYMIEIDENGVRKEGKGDTIKLVRDNTSRDRQPGVFTTSDFRLYRTQKPINYSSTYELNVKKLDAKFTDAKATTEVVRGDDGTLSGFDFILPTTFNKEFSGTVEVVSSENATIYQVYINFNYKEYDPVTKVSNLKTAVINYSTLSGPATQRDRVTFFKPLSSFYEQIAAQVPVDESKLRFFSTMEIIVYAGGDALQKYIALNEPTTGVNQTKPEFPGIENGTGLFSSRTQIIMDNVRFQSGQQEKNKFYLSPALCDRRFTSVNTAGDTLICKAIPGIGREGVPYDE